MSIRFEIPLAIGLMVLSLAACNGDGDGSAEVGSGASSNAEAVAGGELDLGGIPEGYHDGARAYAQYCAECHGQRGEGTDQGPPHVHVVYEPGHHPDQSFHNAARIGVQSHHWDFGNMEPVEGVTDAQLDAIVGYVRWLQREAGIE